LLTVHQWATSHLHLLRTACASRTRGEFCDALLAILRHNAPKTTALPHDDTTSQISDFGLPSNSLDDDYGDDEVLGLFQAAPPSHDRALQSMGQHISHGDFVKARRSLHGSGIASVADIRVRTLLRSKYPPATAPFIPQSSEDIEEECRQPVNHHHTIISDSNALARHIKEKKRGASLSQTGHSNDHYQDLLRFHPDAIHPLMELCNLIAIGTLVDGPARTMLLRGKGTALIKNITDLRPIVTSHPLIQYVGHSVAIQYSPQIQRVCGEQQLMGTKAGCEIAAHLIRLRLEADPTLVVGKVDCKNAFNEIRKDPIIEVIRDEIPALLPFANLMLNMSPIQIVYNDMRAKETSVHEMSNGVSQGGSMSGAFFNLGQSRCIRAASLLHPTVSILLIADDTHVLGQPEDVIAAIHTIRQQYADIGLSLAATTSSKNVIFGLGRDYSAAQYMLATEAGLHWLPADHGLEIGGTPVGSYSFMTEFVNKTTDGIIRELHQLQEFIEGPNGTMRASAQIIYTMIRQCSAQQLSYLLRTCPPSTTLHAARRLDAAIATAVYRITDSTKFLPPVESAAMKTILNRLYLSIRLGGDGMMNSEEIREAAYVGSLLQCAPAIRQFCATAGLLPTDTTVAMSIHEFELAHHSLLSKGVTCLTALTSINIWTSRPQLRMQKKIADQLQSLRRAAALRALPTGPPNTGGALNPLTHHDIAKRRQGITNYTCRASGAWLKSNPAIWFNRMNDNCFNMSFWIRNMFNVMGSRTYCVCGMLMDCLGHHTRVCPRATVKSKASNPAHATLSYSLRQYLHNGHVTGNYIIRAGEPQVGDYLTRRPRVNDRRHPAPLVTQRRADIAMVNLDSNITTLVDVTIASHNAQTAAADYTAGQAAATRTIDKRRDYDRDFETTHPAVQLVIFAVEDSGAVHPEAHQFLRSHALLVSPDNPGRELGHSLASLSVSIQAARAKSVTTARDLLSVDALPPQPYINGVLPIVPPPAWLASVIPPRRYAVMPFPERPHPVPEPIGYQVPWTPPIIYQPPHVNMRYDNQGPHPSTTAPSRTTAGTPRSPSTTPMVIQQPPRRIINVSLPRTAVALSRPSLRRCPSPRVTTSSSSSSRPCSGALHHESTV